MTAPPSRFIILAIRATAGVVIMPASITSWPLESMPAERAFLRRSPEGLGSLPMIILPLDPLPVKNFAPALPTFKASSAVSSRFASPLIPSVPNNLLISFINFLY